MPCPCSLNCGTETKQGWIKQQQKFVTSVIYDELQFNSV